MTINEQKLKIISLIINEEKDTTIEGLFQIFYENDYIYGIELLENDYKDISKDIKADIKETINYALAELSNGNIKDAEKLLKEALNE